MPFSERERTEHLKTLEVCFWARRRPPLHLRDKIREGQRIQDLSIELFFVRPLFRRPGEFVESYIAKLRYVRKHKVWKIFWCRAGGQWHRYPPHPEAGSLAYALRVVDEDEHQCFFG